MRVIRKHVVVVTAAFRVHRVLSDADLRFLDCPVVRLLLLVVGSTTARLVVLAVRLVALEAAADVHLLVVLKNLRLAKETLGVLIVLALVLLLVARNTSSAGNHLDSLLPRDITLPVLALIHQGLLRICWTSDARLHCASLSVGHLGTGIILAFLDDFQRLPAISV